MMFTQCWSEHVPEACHGQATFVPDQDKDVRWARGIAIYNRNRASASAGYRNLCRWALELDADLRARHDMDLKKALELLTKAGYTVSRP